MKNFIQDLKNIACESLNIEDTISVDPYAGMECAEEFMALDDIENAMVANESFSNALMECAFENQLVALEAAGLNGMDDIRHFNGELSNEAVGNMVKRGAYNVKIQVKKAIGKIWSLIMAGVQYFIGADGRFKSYGKLVKKYADKLSKMNASSNNADKDEKEVTIRNWKDIVQDVKDFKDAANTETIKGITTIVKGIETNAASLDIGKSVENLIGGLKHIIDKSGSSNSDYTNATGKFGASGGILQASTIADAEKIEKDLTDYLKDMDIKSDFQQALDEMKDVDSDSVEISKAQSELLGYARQLETELKKDIKFKKELGRLKSAWDKAFGKFELKASNGTSISEADQVRAIQIRCIGKLSSLIADWKVMLGKWYGAVASNIQGFLADMAKVLAKGTKVRG